MVRTAIALSLAAAGAGSSAHAEICVTNDAGTPYHFALETDDGERARATLADGATFCAGAAGGGVAWVFESPESLEGCSRHLDAGASDRLTVYGAFDRCRWGSHDG